MVYYNTYTGGRGGVTGDGRISQFDNAAMLAPIYRDKYDSGVQAQRNGDPNAPSWYQLQEIKAAQKRYEDTTANKGQTGQNYSRPDFEIDSAIAEANEAMNFWGNRKADPRKYMRPDILIQNRGQHMNAMSFGLQSSGMGQGSADMGGGGGGGDELPGGIRESSYTTNGGKSELISNLPGGQLQRWAQDPSGMLHAAGKVNSQFTAFSSPGQYQGQSTAGGFAGIPAVQPGSMAPQAPHVQEYGGAGARFYPNVNTPQGYGSGMSDVDAGVPYQMVRDKQFGKFEGLTDEDYDSATNKRYTTDLGAGEADFRDWVKQNNIPFDPSDPYQDYDMRGYYKALQQGDPNAAQDPDNQHFPDTYKKPWHETFSNESQYADSNAPHWEGGKLIRKDGSTVVDEGDNNYEPADDDLPHPDKILKDEWDDSEGDNQDPRDTNQQIKDAINNRAESQMAGNDTKDLEVESERQRTLKALDDYTKRGFLPGYKSEDGTARPSELTAYGGAINGKERTKGIRRVGSPMVDAAESVGSGAKQIFGRAQDGIKKVFQLSPPELSDDPRFENVRTNVRSDGRMSREEAQAANEILDKGAQKSLDAFRLKQLLESIPELKSHALGEQNPRIALGEAFDRDFQSKTRHEFDPMEAGQIEAQMTGVKKSPRMDNDKRQIPMRPPTHKEVLAQYLSRALMGGIG